MNDEQYKRLLNNQARIERKIDHVAVVVVFIAVCVVVVPALTPLMKEWGWWNIMGWPE